MAKILVIDDMADIRMTIDMILEVLGHDMVEAENGREGIERYKEGGFDLIITDLLMPEIDGTEVILHVKSVENAPPVIAITGGGNSINEGKISVNEALKIAQEKADFVLRKPFTAQELKDAVGTVLTMN